MAFYKQFIALAGKFVLNIVIWLKAFEYLQQKPSNWG